jgi:ADP-heptose:LPS heptosyltransferase
MSLDLIVTIDTVVGHLAGALNRPTWLMLNAKPDTRWRLERGGSFWYPRLRIFQMTRHGAWAPVVARVAAELAGMARRR